MARAAAGSSSSQKTIDAMPTKELFISMLTRDIPLIPAITDLVDNCADGARRIRSNGTFGGFWARLETSPTEFRISDNCGGIPVDIAVKYVFRFGRPDDAPYVGKSVGQFGIGMKRAIFKIGKYFRIESTTKSSRFVVEEDVENWSKNPIWEFRFTELDENMKNPKDRIGTTITVSRLHEDVAEEFELDNFKTELKNELETRIQDPISKGLTVTLNKIPLKFEPRVFLTDDRLRPAYKELKYPERGKKLVYVKLFCGLGKSEDRAAAGWHIFCNGRLILEGDKSAVTGWGEENAGIKIPGFHGQYNHLRGYAYFDSDDPGRLPWNTTKTGLDIDSPVYRATKLEMMKLMLPVKNFLDRLKKEKEDIKDETESGPLEQIVEESDVADLEEVKWRSVFTMPKVPERPVRRGPVMQRIQYHKPLNQVNQVKKALKARSFKQVGEKTFDYFYNAEVEE